MRKKTFLNIVALQTEQSEKHLSEVRSIHKEMRAYKHDFHHHLQALRVQLEAGEYARALQYIDELDDKLQQVDTMLKTGNVALDAILSCKTAKAKEKNIPLSAKANVPDNLTISDVELSILIGNLLENAIESCEKSSDEPFIRLYIAMKGNMLYFSMTNTSGKKLSKISGLFTSSKNEFHGFGLHRAKDIIEQHGGWLKCNSEDGAFTTEFLVPAIS